LFPSLVQGGAATVVVPSDGYAWPVADAWGFGKDYAEYYATKNDIFDRLPPPQYYDAGAVVHALWWSWVQPSGEASYPVYLPMYVSPGNVVQVSIEILQDSPCVAAFQYWNRSSNEILAFQIVNSAVDYSASRSTAEWILERPGLPNPCPQTLLPRFSATYFMDARCSAGSDTLYYKETEPIRATCYDQISGTPLALPIEISNSAFRVEYTGP